jgi:hypothetical protein
MMLVAGDAVEESMADGGSVTTALRAGRARVHGPRIDLDAGHLAVGE